MDDHHVFEVDDDDGRRIVFVCPVEGCGRRIIVVRGEGRYLVVDQGDFFARHTGTVGPISLMLS